VGRRKLGGTIPLLSLRYSNVPPFISLVARRLGVLILLKSKALAPARGRPEVATPRG
jgi:hypothetical protein